MYNYDDSLATGYMLGRDSNNNGYGNGGFGGDWAWIIVLFLIFGWGGFGNNGFGGFGGSGGGNNMAFDLGRLATTNDVASGFSTSEIMSDLNDIILGQAQLQNGINQGFAGLQNTITNGNANIIGTVNQGFAGVNNAICTLGYQNQAGFNGIANQISSCCCDLKQINLENRYLNEKQTCDIVAAINAGNQRLVDLYTSDKISALQTENASLKGQISNDKQSRFIIDELRNGNCPIPAYQVCDPRVPYNYNSNNCGCC